MLHVHNNSIKFTESGTIKVTTSIEKKTNEVVVEITDTGKGIPDEMLTHMFKKFVTTSDKVGDSLFHIISLAYGLEVFPREPYQEAH